MLRGADWSSPSDVSEHPVGPIFKGQTVDSGVLDFWILDPIGCSETSVTNDRSTLRNIPEERKYHLHRGESPKPVMWNSYQFSTVSFHIPSYSPSVIIQPLVAVISTPPNHA